MIVRITDRSEHSKDEAAVPQTFKQKLVSAIKLLLRYILLRPSTWRWLIVNLPDMGEKIEGLIKQLFEFFS
jgi:hypothetical protein